MSIKLLTVLAISSSLIYSAGFAQQAPNSNFNSWGAGPLGEVEPSAWGTSNAFSGSSTFFGPGNNQSVFKDSMTCSNKTYAMKITTTAYKAGGLLGNLSAYLPNGFLDFAFTGQLSESAPYFIPGYIETNRYTQLTFNAEYAPAALTDFGTCAVALTVYHSGTGKRDTIAKGISIISGNVTTCTSYTLTLTYSSNALIAAETPDSAAVVFSSSGTKTVATAGSTLIVSDLSFSGSQPTGVEDFSQLTGSITAFPNPATENITLKNTHSQNNLSMLEVFDMTGRKTDVVLVQNNQTTLNTGAYARGMYFYSAYDENHQLIGVGKFNLVK